MHSDNNKKKGTCHAQRLFSGGFFFVVVAHSSRWPPSSYYNYDPIESKLFSFLFLRKKGGSLIGVQEGLGGFVETRILCDDILAKMMAVGVFFLSRSILVDH